MTKKLWIVIVLLSSAAYNCFCQSKTLKPGDVDPNAKYLDVDVLNPFNNGAAVVQKGNATALIDTGGNFIVPFNKYDISSPVNNDVSLKERWQPTGLFELSNGTKYLNVKGQLIDKQPVSSSVDKKLKDYFVVDEFYEGLACVGKKDEFGILKYGFIDKDGRVVIPLQFTNKPEPFFNGFAKVKPKDQSQFRYAFINKKGDIVSKITDINFAGYSQGYAFDGRYMMDTVGKIFLQSDFLKQFGINYQNGATAISLPDQKGKLQDGKFRVLRSPKNMADKNTQGFIDLTTKKVIDFSFNGYPPIYFDSKAKLSYAEVFLGVDQAQKPIIREGYINEQGIFVIVKGPASKW